MSYVNLAFSDGKETRTLNMRGDNLVETALTLARLPRRFKLIDCEGEGKVAEYFKGQVKLKKLKGKEYKEPSYLDLLKAIT